MAAVPQGTFEDSAAMKAARVEVGAAVAELRVIRARLLTLSRRLRRAATKAEPVVVDTEGQGLTVEGWTGDAIEGECRDEFKALLAALARWIRDDPRSEILEFVAHDVGVETRIARARELVGTIRERLLVGQGCRRLQDELREITGRGRDHEPRLWADYLGVTLSALRVLRDDPVPAVWRITGRKRERMESGDRLHVQLESRFLTEEEENHGMRGSGEAITIPV